MTITFREILRRAGARLSNTSTSTSNDNDLYPKLKDWCNERYERIYSTFPWRASITNQTLQIIASQSDYALNRDIEKILAVFDQTNGRPIRESEVQSHNRFFAEDLDQSGNQQTGDPLRYFGIGDYSVKAETSGSSSENLLVTSTEDTDLTPNIVAITGLVGTAELTETVIITGTTPAITINTFDVDQKLRIVCGTNDETRKSITGIVTIAGSGTSTVFSVISPKEQAPIYKWIRTSTTPKSVTSGTQPTWLIWYSKRIQPLIDDNDIPIIDVSNALVQGIYADGLREDGLDQQAELAEQRFASLVNEKRLADTGPNLIETFVPANNNLLSTLDFGRVIGFE